MTMWEAFVHVSLDLFVFVVATCLVGLASYFAVRYLWGEFEEWID